jgi:hypothetical protein
VRGKPISQLFCGLLAALVDVIIEGDIEGTRPGTELAELVGVEMRAQRTGQVGEACLTQRSVVEQSLDQNHRRAVPDLLPGLQAALAAGQEAMSESDADAAAIQVDDVLALA